MSEPMIRLNCFFGHIRVVSTQRWEGPHRLILGGYAIHYDQDGIETHRTEPQDNIVLTWPE